MKSGNNFQQNASKTYYLQFQFQLQFLLTGNISFVHKIQLCLKQKWLKFFFLRNITKSINNYIFLLQRQTHCLIKHLGWHFLENSQQLHRIGCFWKGFYLRCLNSSWMCLSLITVYLDISALLKLDSQLSKNSFLFTSMKAI